MKLPGVYTVLYGQWWRSNEMYYRPRPIYDVKLQATIYSCALTSLQQRMPRLCVFILTRRTVFLFNRNQTPVYGFKRL